MGFQAKQMFVNLPVKDLKQTIAFFTKIGFEFNKQFTDDNATCMIIGENIYAMLLVEPYFQTFITKEIVDTSKQAEAIIALSVASKAEVDEVVNAALAAGGFPSKEPQDHGFMYSRSFQDIDGHLWEVFYMDESAIQQG
ncbi:extradiol dioxygenase [Paenibacillus marchantiophytorum]|uniref:Extradiol dioxygenase n=1 Tax=Paenibacillus marchantiophytorum TaxID=1619310 RepID=A0ABQ1FGE7_9BACL|nr:VOC family protein [Paenibacillus marchantiophytorum]GGA09463.1 extradiol dioxygenase [Paenibacillus marchantiophytorum]